VDRSTIASSLRGTLRCGTSGWDYPDWVGPFYAAGTARREFLTRYAERLRSVEIDSTYYRMPTARDVAGWAARTPPGFLFSPKVPQEITHEKLLVDCAEEVARFVEALASFGDKLGVVVVQCRYFRSAEGMSAERFAERRAPFLRLFPQEMRVAVEVRNKALWRPPVLQVLREQGRALVVIDHPWMDPPERIAARDDLTPAPFAYVRLLGDREAIEKVTTKWGETVVDQSSRLANWADWVARTLDEGRDVWVAANNHYAGHGPATIEELERRVREKLGA
jgi:uncharacterized protein YecE (DUF72 family)